MPSLAGFLLFFIVPFLISVYYCFFKRTGDTTVFLGLSNFKAMFGNAAFRLAAKNTLVFNGAAIVLLVVLALLLALFVFKQIKGIGFFRSVFIYPLVLPTASLILVWQLLFDNNGYVNVLIEKLGGQGFDWLGSTMIFWVVLLMFVWKNLGYCLVLFLAGLNNIPVEHYEAAAIDGANGRQRFFRITLPALLPSAVIVVIMAMANSFKVFKEAYLLAGLYPPESIYLLQHYMNNNFFKLNYQNLSTAAFLVFAVILVLLFALLRFQRRVSEDFT